jgi:hypothetical protein
MEWPIIVAVVAVVPLILVPVALIWYIQVSGIYTVLKERRKRAAKRAAYQHLAEVKARGGE